MNSELKDDFLDEVSNSTYIENIFSITDDIVYTVPFMNMTMKFVGFNSEEQKVVIKNIKISAEKFDRIISILPSPYKHEGIIYKWDGSDSTGGLYKQNFYDQKDKRTDNKITFNIKTMYLPYVIQHEMAHAYTFYNTQGNYIYNKNNRGNHLLIEGIARFIDSVDNERMQGVLKEAAELVLGNGTYSNYTMQDFFTMPYAYYRTYTMGGAIMKFAQIHNPGAILYTLKCMGNIMSHDQAKYGNCLDSHFNIDISKFKSWLSPKVITLHYIPNMSITLGIGWSDEQQKKFVRNVNLATYKFSETIGMITSYLKYDGSLSDSVNSGREICNSLRVKNNTVNFRLYSTLDEYDIQYSIAYALTFYNTQGKCLISYYTSSILSEGIASYIKILDNSTLTQQYLQEAANIFLNNNALQSYTLHNLLNIRKGSQNPYIGAALIEYAQMYHPKIVYNTLKCVRDSSGNAYENCSNTHFNIDMSGFKFWLNGYKNIQEEYPIIYIYGEQEIFSCSQNDINKIEEVLKSEPELVYNFLSDSQTCFPLLYSNLPHNVPVLFYHHTYRYNGNFPLYKVEYNPSSGVFHLSTLNPNFPYKLEYNKYSEEYSKFSAHIIKIFEDIIKHNYDLNNIENLITEIISDIPSLSTSSVSDDNYLSRLIIKLKTNEQPCSVIDCNSVPSFGNIEPFVTQCQNVPFSTEKNKFIVQIQSNSIQQFICFNNWKDWILYGSCQYDNITVHLERGCRSMSIILTTNLTTSTTTPSTTTFSITSSTTNITYNSVYTLPYINMTINFVHLRSNEKEEVIKNIDLVFEKFASTIGIGQSKFKHEGTFYKLSKEELSKTANYHIQGKYDDTINFYINSTISDKAIQHAITQAMIYYHTEGNTLLNKKGNYNGFLIEGITSFIEMERNSDLTFKYLECGANNMLNSALKYYSLDQLFELQPTYMISCVGSALLKYTQLSKKRAVFNFLYCLRKSSMPEIYEECTNSYFNINMYDFQSWLSNFRGSDQEHSIVFIYADKSEIFSCTPNVLKEGESKFNNAKDLYSFFYQSQECFTLLYNQLPKDLPVTLYHNSHKIKYSPSNSVFRVVELSVHYPYEHLLGEYKNNSIQFVALTKYIENISLETSKGNYTSLSYLYDNMIDSIGIVPTTTRLFNTTEFNTSSPNIELINDYTSYIHVGIAGLGGILATVLGGLLLKKVCCSQIPEAHYSTIAAVTKGAYDIVVDLAATTVGEANKEIAFQTTEHVHKNALDAVVIPLIGLGSEANDSQ
ncbi:MAG: hypothetical protein AB8U25_06740 [Rickettsiales endosymbiont of Dermacentor nuttalli]